jgi:hypothetical protein
MLLAVVESVIRRLFQILCALCGRIHGRTCGYKWSLLKVREEKGKREHDVHRWNLEAES